MKSKIIKRIAGITSIGLVGIITVGTILNNVIPAKAEGTLFGIETLIQEVQNRENPYRILEIVPDEQTSEIGYFIPGYEPVLSSRQEGTGVWEDWEEGLKQLRTAEERASYMENLKVALQDFLALRGFEGDNVPVTYLGYEESEEPVDGYTKLDFEELVVNGYFQPYSGTEGATRYDLNFRYAGNYNEEEFKGELTTQYYYVQAATQVTTAMFDSLTDDAVLYRFVSQVGADRFERAGTWGELKSIFEDTDSDGDEAVDETVDETVEGDAPVDGGEMIEEDTAVVNVATVSGGDIITSRAVDSVSGSDAGTNPEVPNPESEIPELEIPEPETPKPEIIEPVSPDLEAVAEDGSEPEGDDTEVNEPEGSEPEENEPEEGEPTEFYQVIIQPWSQEIHPDYPALYAIDAAIESDSGSFEFFVDEEHKFGYGFSTDAIYYKGGFVNNEWFHINVLNMQPGQTESFPMEVITLTVSELNAMAELPAFDMLYLNSGMQSFVNNEEEPITGYSIDNDILKAIGIKIFEDVIINAKPCIVDASLIYALDEQGNVKLVDTEIFRLAARFLQKSPSAYCNDVLANAESENIDDLINGIVEDEDKNFVVEQVYSFFTPEKLISPDFSVADIYDGNEVEEGFEAVLDEIRSENLNREADNSDAYEPLPTDVSKATAVRHIMNYAHRRQIKVKESIRVLEIQPAKSHEDSYDLTKEEIMKWAPEVKEVQIDRMTTAEFIGKIEDINEIYDLVYIGTDRDSMNVVSGTEQMHISDNLVTNSGFENGTNGWSIWYTGDVTAENVLNGSNAFWLSSTATQIIKAEPETTYTLSAWGKSGKDGLRGTIGVDYMSGTSDDETIAGGIHEVEFTSTTYTNKSFTFTTLPGTKYIKIYMWSGGERMYFDDISLKKITTSNSAIYDGSTVFNDSSMDGLIYFHTGDMRYTGMELAGQLDTEYVDGKERKDNLYYYNPVRYGGNDITDDKRKALLSFLDASYPIIVSDEVFESAATVYQHADWKGYNANLKPGRYDRADLEAHGIRNDDISSIKVSAGYQVTLYMDEHFSGSSRILGSTSNYLGNDWNDQVTSMVIEPIEGEESLRTRKIDEDHIDNSSFMHEFIEEAMAYTNFYARSDMNEDSSLFKFYLNRPKVSLTNVIANNTTPDAGVIDIYPEHNGKYMLEYRFTIQNEGAASANTEYECELYIDVNADGKYSVSEKLGDITLTQNGQAVSSTNLYAGREYVLRRYVPDGYKGVLPWKIQICQKNNDDIHNGVTGYAKLAEQGSETINILQICRDAVTDVDWWGGADEKFFNLEERLKDPGDIYHILVNGGDYEGEHYSGISKDFKINVNFMHISEFVEEFEEHPDMLNDYNMLILGFSDAYGNIPGNSETGPIRAIIDFIDSGKSVLFAHDTVSYFNYEKERVNENGQTVAREGAVSHTNTGLTKLTDQYHNSYNLATYIRGLVGMDRYGITKVSGLRDGNNLTAASTNWIALEELGKEMAFIPKTNKEVTTGLTHGYTYSIINGKDINQTGGRHETFTSDQTGGESFTNKYLNLDYGLVYYYDNSADDGEIKDAYNAEVDNLWVTKVNSGQITDYPYKLKDEFLVSMTHAQYYQLDFTADDDEDGQSDLVVWYCLGYRKNANGDIQETIYSMSPNDVSNNYYIYNKGNITYTGVGHAGNKTTVEEAKLFINTMIASYAAGMKDPAISVLSDSSGNANEIDTFYSYYDGENNLYFDSAETTESTQDGKKKLYFTVSDPNFVKGTRKIAVRCYYESDAQDFVGTENITYQGKTVSVKPFDMVSDSPQLEVYNASTNQKADIDNLTSGGIYYILFDDDVMGNFEDDNTTGDYESRFSVYFEVQSSIWKQSIINPNGILTKTDKAYGRFNYTKVQLFNLE